MRTMSDRWTGDHPFGTCANCGDAFEPEVSYPVVTRDGGDGELELYSFCDEECMRAWEVED